MTQDFVEKFWLIAMNRFYVDMNADLVRYAQKLAKYIEKGNEREIQTYLRMIKETRKTIDDISTEKMTVKEFARRLFEIAD